MYSVDDGTDAEQLSQAEVGGRLHTTDHFGSVFICIY